MKKFNIKTLLILVLALMLVFTLVACNPEPEEEENNNNNENGQYSISKSLYFDQLWALSKSVGKTDINQTDSLALSADLAVSLIIGRKPGDANASVVDLGVALDVVLDRESMGTDSKLTGAKSAVKVRLYDPATKATWVCLYYFVDDPYNLYIDFDGQSIVLPFDTGYNNTYAQKVIDFIQNNKVIPDKKNDKGEVIKEGVTISQIINAVSGDMGENWTINNLIGGLTKVLGLDLKTLLSENTMVTTVLAAFKVDVDTLVDNNGVVHLDNLFKVDLVQKLFTNVTKKPDANDSQRQVYNASLNISSLLGLIGNVSSLMKDATDETKELVDNLINQATDISISFGEKNQAIDGLTISAAFKGIRSSASMFPTVQITINELSFDKADLAKREQKFGITKSNYDSEITANLSAQLDVKGISLKGVEEGADNIVLDGVYSVGLKGKLDLKQIDMSKNGTVAYAYIAKDGQPFVEASFANGDLAVTIDRAVETQSGESIVETLVKYGGKAAYDMLKAADPNGTALDKLAEKIFTNYADDDYTLNATFAGAKWTNINIVQGFGDLLSKITAPKQKASTAQELSNTSEEEPTGKVIGLAAIMDVIKNAMNVIKSDNNGLQLSLAKAEDALKFLRNTNVGKNPTAAEKAITLEDFKTFIKNHDKSGMLAVVEQNIVLKDITLTSTNGLIDVAAKASAKVSLSLKDGVKLGASVKVSNSVSVDANIAIDAVAYNASDYKVIGKDVNAQTAGWFVFEF